VRAAPNKCAIIKTVLGLPLTLWASPTAAKLTGEALFFIYSILKIKIEIS
jgi:hypothetical protein